MRGLSQFINELLLHPTPLLKPTREAFLASYTGKSGANRFTKVRMELDADAALWDYFGSHEADIKSWFNVIAPNDGNIDGLRTNLRKLANQSTRSEQLA